MVSVRLINKILEDAEYNTETKYADDLINWSIPGDYFLFNQTSTKTNHKADQEFGAVIFELKSRLSTEGKRDAFTFFWLSVHHI